jgi:hypothetical protein
MGVGGGQKNNFAESAAKADPLMMVARSDT